jgi:uncharacterized protein (DUF2384 family)
MRQKVVYVAYGPRGPRAVFASQRSAKAAVKRSPYKLMKLPVIDGVNDIARFVWGSASSARSFLNYRRSDLQGRKLADLMKSKLGAELVEGLLWDAFYGLGGKR